MLTIPIVIAQAIEEDASGSGLVVTFVFLIAILVAGIAGYFVGTIAGRTEGSNLGNATAVARQQVDGAASRLRLLSGRLVGADKRGELAGEALVLSTKLTGVANELARLERSAGATQRGGDE